MVFAPAVDTCMVHVHADPISACCHIIDDKLIYRSQLEFCFIVKYYKYSTSPTTQVCMQKHPLPFRQQLTLIYALSL